MVPTRGFTLIEILVAIALSGIIITALLGVFFSFIENQASSQDQRNALESIRFMLADISHDVSFGKNYRCDTTNYPVLDASMNALAGQCRCITFTDQLQRTVKIRYNSTEERVEKSTKLLDRNPGTCAALNDANDLNTWGPVTDSSVDINELKFTLESSANRQPQVKVFASAGYELDGVSETISVKTQVTKRTLDPGRSVLGDFRIGVDVPELAKQHFFIYAPCPAGSTECTTGTTVCQDESGNVYSTTTACDVAQRPVAAEFTEHGLYVLVDNGLIFFIPQSSIDGANGALSSTGAIVTGGGVVTTAQKIVSASSLQSTVKRVIGTGGCRLCSSDPSGVLSLHVRRSSASAHSHDGSLYQINTDGTATNADRATRLLNGGSTGKLLQIATDGGVETPGSNFFATGRRTLLLFTGSTGVQTLRLLSRKVLGANDVRNAGCNYEFRHVQRATSASHEVCRQLVPDPVPGNSAVVEPTDLSTIFNTTTGIPLSFIDRLQVINETIHLWYADNVGRHLLSIGQGYTKKKRSEGANTLDTMLVTGGPLAFGAGIVKYTFPCSNGSALCVIDTIDDVTFTTTDSVAVPSTFGTLVDHTHFQNYPIGVSSNGRLIYFTGLGSSTAAAKEVKVFNTTPVVNADTTVVNTGRVLCDAQAYQQGTPGAGSSTFDQQISFGYISKKHPTKSIVAAIGSVYDISDGKAVHELYLLAPTSATKKQFNQGELVGVCGSNNVERYHLPTNLGGPPLDLVRLTGVRFVDTP